MSKYETMFVVRPDVDEETLKATRERVQSVITSEGGEIQSMDDMGKRRLAYLIDKHREGFYSLMTYQASADAVAELDRIININDQIIRHMTVNLDD